MSFFLRYKWHFLSWAAYLVFWTGYSIKVVHVPFFSSLLVSISYAIGQGGLIYFCVYRMFPLYFNQRRYGVFSLILSATIALTTLLILGLHALIFRLVDQTIPYTITADLWYILAANLNTAFIVIAIKSIRDKVLNDRRTQMLEKENTDNELRFLRSQMNPHFLFNAINSIYVLIKKDPELASHTLVKFADMLRYQLYDCNADRIPIEKEIVYLDNYIGLEQLRKGNTLCTEYQVSEEVRHFSIAPLLIIPFVENAFKYVSSYSDRPNRIAINLSCSDGLFELSVKNTVDDSTAPLSRNALGGGIGLENVRRRLQLIYNNHHQLEIRKEEKYYAVLLKIPIQ